jgi:hypothetical protein
MLSMNTHVLTYINVARKQILYQHNMFCISMKEIIFRGVMWHTYSRCCKKPVPDGWNFVWWWSQMQDVTFTWTWWLFCTKDKFTKHAGTGKLVCLMRMCFRSAQTHKYFYMSILLTRLLGGWFGVEGQGGKSGNTAHNSPGIFNYKTLSCKWKHSLSLKWLSKVDC